MIQNAARKSGAYGRDNLPACPVRCVHRHRGLGFRPQAKSALRTRCPDPNGRQVASTEPVGFFLRRVSRPITIPPGRVFGLTSVEPHRTAPAHTVKSSPIGPGGFPGPPFRLRKSRISHYPAKFFSDFGQQKLELDARTTRLRRPRTSSLGLQKLACAHSHAKTLSASCRSRKTTIAHEAQNDRNMRIFRISVNKNILATGG